MAVIDFAAYTRRAKGRVSAVDGADRRDGTALDTSFDASLHMGRRGSVDGARSVEACPAVAAFGRVCRANDTWCGHVPGESGDGRAVRELDDAYNAFFNSKARTMEGLRLQFEILLAVAGIEENESIDQRSSSLIGNMRLGFARISDIDTRG